VERSSKFLFTIYVELLRIIKPLEQPNSFGRRDRNAADVRPEDHSHIISSSRQSQQEDELEDEDLLNDLN